MHGGEKAEGRLRRRRRRVEGGYAAGRRRWRGVVGEELELCAQGAAMRAQVVVAPGEDRCRGRRAAVSGDVCGVVGGVRRPSMCWSTMKRKCMPELFIRMDSK